MEEVEDFKYLGCGLIGSYEVMFSYRRWKKRQQKSGLEVWYG